VYITPFIWKLKNLEILEPNFEQQVPGLSKAIQWNKLLCKNAQQISPFKSLLHSWLGPYILST
jgi:hypothetical protein